MSVTSPRRAGRREPGGARVVVRDTMILRFIGHAGVVTSRDVAALLGMSHEMAKRRLHRLHSLGHVAKTVTAMEAPTRYTLTRSALPILERLFEEPEGGWRVLRSVEMNLDHHDGQVAMHVAFAVATTRSRWWKLARYLYEYEIRRRLGSPASALIPDAIAILADGNGEKHAIAIEWDGGTENPSYLAERKLRPYCEVHTSPLMACESWTVAWLSPSIRRRNRLVQAGWDAGIDEGVHYFLARDEVSDRTVLGPAWWTPQAVGGVGTLVRSDLFGAVVAEGVCGNNGSPVPASTLGADFAELSGGRLTIPRAL